MAVPKQAGKESAAVVQDPNVPKWIVVQNLTSNLLIIPPDTKDGRADIALQPWDAEGVKSADWTEDANLLYQSDLGKVMISQSNRKPRHVPPMPAEASTNQPRLDAMMAQIVLGEDTLAEQFIDSERRFLDRARQPLDVEWMRISLGAVLKGARLWLLAWGPPERLKHRVELIDAKLEAISHLVG